MEAEVVLTSDRGSFSEYSGANALGYVACMPYRLVPRPFMNLFFTPPMKATRDGAAILAPYALRKIEATLLTNGIRNVVVAPPESLHKVIGPGTKVVGITVHDPYGLSPVSTKLSLMFGGGEAWTARFFDDLSESILLLKKRFGFKVIAGGPGIWQMDLKRPDWIDVVFSGEAEIDLPGVIRGLLGNSEAPAKVTGHDPKVGMIPTIVRPARYGEVQVTRGCPRGCQFCSITPEMFRSIPIEDIIREVQVNLSAGQKSIDLVTDDILLYGSHKLATNHDEVVKLFREVKNAGAEQIYFPHISSPAVKDSPETVLELASIAEYDKYTGEIPVVGLESGSTRIVDKYMRGKAYPWTPADWSDIIADSAGIMNDAHITPCFTMTIGFMDETEEDVKETIKLAQRLIDNNYRALMFPLPVIPITRSRLRKNSFPDANKLPKGYWDLLYICWKRDLDLIRGMTGSLTYRIPNGIAQKIAAGLMDRVFGNIEMMFEQLRDTSGKKAQSFSDVTLNGMSGLINSIFKIVRISIGKSRKETEKLIS